MLDQEHTQAALVPVATARLGHLPSQLPDGLTPREAEVLVLIAAGMTNPQIAAHLHISPATVKSHINRVFTKANVTDRASATDYAYRHNLSPR
jgi:DNA-binding NarL/FixJ family response regulator